MSAVGVPVLLLGLLTLAGTLVTVFVTAPVPRNTVPACCRRRVDTFVSRSRITVVSAGVVTGVGAVLLLIDLLA